MKIKIVFTSAMEEFRSSPFVPSLFFSFFFYTQTLFFIEWKCKGYWEED